MSLFNERARTLFSLAPSDRGRPIQDLELSYRPAELRGAIEQARDDRRPVSIKTVEWQTLGRDARYFDVQVVPLLDGAGQCPGISISFADVSHVQDLQQQPNRSKQDLETAYEELQSTNEELQTINEELRQRTDDVNRANGFFESILTSVRTGVVVVDRELAVIAWNHRAEDLWGLRSDEVRGQNFLNLDIGLPIADLRAGIRACLGGDGDFSEVVLPARNRRGKSISCKVSITPMLDAHSGVRGAILLMEEQAVVH